MLPRLHAAALPCLLQECINAPSLELEACPERPFGAVGVWVLVNKPRMASTRSDIRVNSVPVPFLDPELGAADAFLENVEDFEEGEERKQKCDRKIPCKPCIDRGVGHLCHFAEPGSNRNHVKLGADGQPLPPRKRRKRAEIEAAAARDHIVAQARSVISKAAGGDEDAFGRLQRFLGEASYPNSEETSSYVGPASIQNMISAAGGSNSFLPALPSVPLTVPGSGDLLGDLLPKELCDHLVGVFRTISPAFYIIQYSPVALSRFYDNVWDVLNRRGNTNFVVSPPAILQPVSHSFVLLLSMVCTWTLHMLPLDSVPFVSQYGDPTELRRRTYSTAREALMRSELEELPDLCRIEAITMMGTYLKNEGRPNDQYILHASAIRAAQALGMHRHSSTRWGIEPFEEEMRKRVWWALYAYDKYASFHLGRPYVIQDKHCDVSLPTNLNHRDLTAGRMEAAKPLQEYTDSSVLPYLISECILGGIVGRIFDRAFSTHTPDYSTVHELDAELQTMEVNIPPALRAPTLDDKLAYPGIEKASRAFHVIVCKIRAMLHRPYLLKPLPAPGQVDKYARSRQITIILSRQQISTFRATIADTPLHLRNNFLFSHCLWEAGCQLAIALRALTVSQENEDEAKVLDAQVLQARRLLEELSLHNRTAGNAIRMIDFLRSRYAAIWSFVNLAPSAPSPVPLSSLQSDHSGSLSDTSGITPVSSVPESSIGRDPLEYLLWGEDRPSEQANAFAAPGEWQTVGGLFETGAHWQQSLDDLLQQVGELE